MHIQMYDVLLYFLHMHVALPFSVGNVGSHVVGYVALFGETLLTVSTHLVHSQSACM